MFWPTDPGSTPVIRVPSWDTQAMKANAADTGIDFDADSTPSRSGGQDAVTYM
jgi:hypothetical protein